MYQPVTIGIINHNGEHFITECLDAVREVDYPNYVVMVVDNKSEDRSVRLIQKNFPDVRVIELTSNVGANRARNVCIREAETNFVFLVENDAVIH